MGTPKDYPVGEKFFQKTHHGVRDPFRLLLRGQRVLITREVAVSEVPGNESQLVTVVVDLDITDFRVCSREDRTWRRRGAHA
jgi:hypothetical protein